jgi:ribosomal protein L44E
MAAVAGNDRELLFAFRRKVAKELSYDERSKPIERRKLKLAKRKEQSGRCAICQNELPASYNVLDRFRAADGYTAENTRLICEPCDRKVQASRGYA